MGDNEPTVENKRFGMFLRGLREERRLSLDAVEELSLGLPERVTKSHLSRIENGRAVPTFPRMFSLSQIYGIPVAYLAERFEISLIREMAPVKTTDEKPAAQIIDLFEALKASVEQSQSGKKGKLKPPKKAAAKKTRKRKAASSKQK